MAMQDETFGKRVTPSLTTAMQRYSQPWSASPCTSSPMALSQPLQDSYEISAVEYEQFLMDKVDTVLKDHFKDIERKLKRVKSKVENINIPTEMMKSILIDLQLERHLLQISPIIRTIAKDSHQISWKRKPKASNESKKTTLLSSASHIPLSIP